MQAVFGLEWGKKFGRLRVGPKLAAECDGQTDSPGDATQLFDG